MLNLIIKKMFPFIHINFHTHTYIYIYINVSLVLSRPKYFEAFLRLKFPAFFLCFFFFCFYTIFVYDIIKLYYYWFQIEVTRSWFKCSATSHCCDTILIFIKLITLIAELTVLLATWSNARKSDVLGFWSYISWLD